MTSLSACLLDAYSEQELHHFVTTWLDIRNLCRLDSSLTSHRLRNKLLSLYNGSDKSRVISQLMDERATDTYALNQWIIGRSLQLHHETAHVTNAYAYIQKRFKSLFNLAPSIGRNSRKRRITSCGAMDDDSAKEVFSFMGQNYLKASHIQLLMTLFCFPSQGEGVRFLDTACGNGVFCLLVKMLYPKAQVVALELDGMFNSLRLVQEHTNYIPMKQIQFIPFKTKNDFRTAFAEFAPTHVVCMVGNKEINDLMISAVHSTRSATFLAVARPRRSKEMIPFHRCGYMHDRTITATFALSGIHCTIELARPASA